MRYIDNEGLREWVQERLQRKLIQQAHELAVQTGCEVLLRLQDGKESQNSKYYVTEGLKSDYFNRGFRLSPGDQPMSGESGLPKRYVKDFNCQVSSISLECEGNARMNARPDRGATGYEGGMHLMITGQGVPSNEYCKKLRDGVWYQQVSPPPLQVESNLHETDSRSTNASSTVQQTCSPSIDVTTNNITDVDTKEPGGNRRDDVLRELKSLHLRKFSGRLTKSQEHVIQEHVIHGHVIHDHVSPQTRAFLAFDGSMAVGDDGHAQENMTTLTRQEDTPSRGSGSRDISSSVNPETAPTTVIGNAQQNYLCRLCESTFCDLYQLVSHAKMLHSNISQLKFSCNSCESSFEDANSLLDHLSHGHGGFLVGAACEINGVPNSLNSEQRRFCCPQCGKLFSRFGFMQSHVERIHGTSSISTSTYVAALSKPPSSAREGSSDHEPPLERFECRECNAIFDKEETLNHHVEELHSLKENNLPTVRAVGDAVEIQFKKFQSHALLSTSNQIYSCQECGDQFSRAKLLQNHVNSCHIPGNCNPVHRRPDQNEGLQRSSLSVIPRCQEKIMGVIPNGNIVIKIPKRERTDAILDLSTTSTSKSMFIDTTCGGGFAGSQLTETGVGESESVAAVTNTRVQRTRRKRFECDVCGKTYKHCFHMKEHRLTHAAVCPFVCRVCGMGFFRQRQLRDHELRHTGAYPCRCQLCGKGFPRTSELKRHLAFRHRRYDGFRQKTSRNSSNGDQ